MSIEAINAAGLKTRMLDNTFPGRALEGTSSAQQAQKSPNNAAISPDLMAALNHDMEALHHVGLEFSVNDSTGHTVVKVMDKDTGRLIRQIPPQELLDLAAKLEDMMGILFDKKV